MADLKSTARQNEIQQGSEGTQEEKSKAIETNLQDLTPTEATDYSLWKATKKVMKHQQAKTPLRLDESKWA